MSCLKSASQSLYVPMEKVTREGENGERQAVLYDSVISHLTGSSSIETDQTDRPVCKPTEKTKCQIFTWVNVRFVQLSKASCE